MSVVMRRQTLNDVIILAAAKLGEQFTEADLAVACWKMDCRRFGMRGFETRYPDTKIIAAVLSARPNGMEYAYGKTPVAKGMLERIAPRTFRLTESGWRRYKELRAGK